MGDNTYDSLYLKRKMALREMHQKLKESKDTQEIYHTIMGTAVGNTDTEEEK